MALVILNNDKKIQMAPDSAVALWNVLTGKTEGNEQQQKFALTVKKVYLNWRTAPDDYLIKNREILVPIVKNEWMVSCAKSDAYGEHTSSGISTRPDPTDKTNIRVSRILGLTGQFAE